MYYFMNINRHTLYHKSFNDGMNVLRIYSILFCCEKRMDSVAQRTDSPSSG